jgi:DNA-binding NarL/FixJ family response regulator
MSPSPSPSPTILLVDDDAFNREGVRLYLEQEGFAVCEAGDAATAWQMFATAGKTAPPLAAAIVDIAIPAAPGHKTQLNHSLGIRLVRQIKAADPAFGIVLFSAYEDRGGEIQDMIGEGCRGIAYKLKGCRPATLLAALDDVMAGGMIIDEEVTNTHALVEQILRQMTPEELHHVEMIIALLHELTQREHEVASRVTAAHSNEGIAQSLALEPKTVENYIGRIYDKLGLRDAPRHLRRAVLLAKAFMICDLRGQVG